MEKLEHNFEYLQLFNEENISKNDLPEQIQKKISEIARYVGRYNNNPTEKIKNTIIKKDIEICDLIVNWKENKITEETPEEIEARKQVAAELAKKEAEIKQQAATDAETKAKQQAAENKEAKAKADKEAAANEEAKIKEKNRSVIIAKIKDNTIDGKIKTNILKTIINLPFPTPRNIIIGELNLRKIYLGATYQVK